MIQVFWYDETIQLRECGNCVTNSIEDAYTLAESLKLAEWTVVVAICDILETKPFPEFAEAFERLKSLRRGA